MGDSVNFNFSTLLKMQTHNIKHKLKPTQFISVAGGVKKRLEWSIINKRRSRLTNFDNFRNLPQSKPPVQEQLDKVEQRRLQLQKWKEEKERKKAQALAQKKKPFLAGKAKTTLKFEPPPSISWPLPSTSGRVTRSQTRSYIMNNKEKQKDYKFAPHNAAFNPMLKDLDKPALFGAIKCKPQNKQQLSIKLKTPHVAPHLEPRNLRSRIKSSDEIKLKQTQNELNVQNKTTPKKKTTKQPLKEAKTVTLRRGTKLRIESNNNIPMMGEIAQNNTSTTKIPDNVHCSPKMSSPNSTVTPKKHNSTVQDFIVFTPMKPVPKSESSSEEKLRSPKALDELMTPQQISEEAKKISPRVYLSRGKENNRKEMKKRLEEGLLDEDVCDMSVEHFRRQLDSEIKRMTEMCELWDKILEQVTLPDEIQEAVLAAVGQARLLMSQKLQQFASLLRRCEQPEPGQALVTRADLLGFWDMVFLQVENVDIRFKKLEESRARGWATEEPGAATAGRPNLQPRPAQPKQAPPRQAQPKPRQPNNRLKEIIAAARKAKQASTNKTFEAGFFSVQSPVKSPATPRRAPSLLQSVLSSEAKKASSKKSSYAILRASLIGKSVDSEEGSSYEANLVALTPINFGLTPGKSILKSNNNTSTKVMNKITFKLFSSDMTSDSSPNSDDGRIFGVERLQNLDSSQDSSPTKLQDFENTQDLENIQSTENLPKSETLLHSTQNLDSFENLQISDTGKGSKINRRYSSNKKKSIHNAENNSVINDSEKLGKDKENKHSSRKMRQSSHDFENILILTDTIKLGEEKENRRSSRRTRQSLHNAEDNSVITDSEKLGEEKESRRSSRRTRQSLHHAEDNSVNTDSEKLGEEKEKRRSSRKTRQSLHHAEDNSVNTDSINQENRRSSRRRAHLDAIEKILQTPVMTRSNTRHVPASENLDSFRSSRTQKSEVNDEKLAVTPTKARFRRRI